MKISIIIPNYNGEDLLKKNLGKVIDLSLGEKYEIEFILVDDGSTDNSLEVAEKILSSKKSSNNFSYTVLKSKKNKGFSSNANKGVNASTAELLLLLNTDIIPEKGFLKPLVNHFKDDKVFAVGCMDKSVEGEKTVLRGRGVGSWKRGFLVHAKGEVYKKNTLWVSGGSGMFRKSIWSKLGGFDPLYNPFYWEDIDLSYRALKSGCKILFEKESVVLHEHEKGSIKSKFSSFKIKTIAYRNQIIFAWKNLTDLNLLLKHVLFIPYHLLKAILSLDFAFILGFFRALFILPVIIKSKLKAKKLFVKKDTQVVAEFI